MLTVFELNFQPSMQRRDAATDLGVVHHNGEHYTRPPGSDRPHGLPMTPSSLCPSGPSSKLVREGSASHSDLLSDIARECTLMGHLGLGVSPRVAAIARL